MSLENQITRQPESVKYERPWLAAIIGVALVLRLIAALILGNEVTNLPGTFDQVSYDMLAQRVVAGHGFTVAEMWWPATPAGEPTAHWSYLYTLYLTAFYALAGYQPLLARIFQAVLAGLLMPWLIYQIGKRHFGTTVGLVSAGLMAIYPYFVYYAAALMTETFYITGILWTLNLAGQLGQSQQNPVGKFNLQWLWLGLALSITILLRQVFLLFVPVLFCWLLWQSYRYRVRPMLQMIGIMAGATAILILMILPWTIRNYRAFDTFVLLNTNAGFAFFWGNHPIHGDNFVSILPYDGPSYQDLIPTELLTLNEAELDRALLKEGLGFIQAEPVRYVVLSTSRIKDYFKFWPSSDSGTISNISRVFSFGILLPFMLVGFFYYLRRSLFNETLILYLFVITYTGIHLLTWALIRYRLPVDAVLLIFSAAAMVKLVAMLSRQFGKPQDRADFQVTS
jgi:hypothetical protein